MFSFACSPLALLSSVITALGHRDPLNFGLQSSGSLIVPPVFQSREYHVLHANSLVNARWHNEVGLRAWRVVVNDA